MLLAALDPVRERRVQLRPTRPRDARVRDLPRERVLDRVLELPGKRRAAAPPHEVALLEQREIRVAARSARAPARPRRRVRSPRPPGARTSPAPEAGRCERRARPAPSPGCRCRAVAAQPPAAVLALEHAAVDQRRRELLDEERVALAARDDERRAPRPAGPRASRPPPHCRAARARSHVRRPARRSIRALGASSPPTGSVRVPRARSARSARAAAAPPSARPRSRAPPAARTRAPRRRRSTRRACGRARRAGGGRRRRRARARDRGCAARRAARAPCPRSRAGRAPPGGSRESAST